MKFLTLFLFINIAIITPLFSMTEEKTGVSQELPKSKLLGFASIEALIQDLRTECSHFLYLDLGNGEHYEYGGAHDVLIRLLEVEKTPELLVESLEDIFTHTQKLQLAITPELVAAIIKYLKIPVNNINTQGLGLLHEAVFNNNGLVITTLCLAGTKVNQQTLDQTQCKWTPLHFAASQGHDEACRVLLEYKAPVNAVTSTDDTPLHFAAENGHTQVCKRLKAAGADMLKKNSIKKTPGGLGRKHPTIAEVFGDLTLS